MGAGRLCAILGRVWRLGNAAAGAASGLHNQCKSRTPCLLAPVKQSFRIISSQSLRQSEAILGMQMPITGLNKEDEGIDDEELEAYGDEPGIIQGVELEDQGVLASILGTAARKAGKSSDPIVDTRIANGLWQRLGPLKFRHAARSVSIINHWIAEGRELTKGALIIILVRMRRRRRYEQALKIMEWIQKSKFIEYDQRDAVHHLDLITRMGKLALALNKLETLLPEQKTEVAYNVILSAFLREDKVELAEKFLRDMKRLGVIKTHTPFNLLITLYNRKELQERIPSVLEDAKTLGIAPDICTYNILMGIKCKSGDIKEVEKFYDELVSMGVKPIHTTCAMLAHAYIKANMPEKAVPILQEIEMKANSGYFRKHRMTYEVLMTMYGSLKKADQVERIWNFLCERRWTTNYSHISYLESLGNAGAVAKAEEHFKTLDVSNNPSFTSHADLIVNALLGVYTKQSLVYRAEVFASRMYQQFRIEPDGSTYHHLIRMYVNAGNLDKSLETFRKAQLEGCRSRRWKPWTASFKLVLDLLVEAGDVSTAEELFASWKRDKCKMNIQIYNALLSIYIKAGKPAPPDIMQRIKDEELVPNQKTQELLSQLKPVKRCLAS